MPYFYINICSLVSEKANYKYSYLLTLEGVCKRKRRQANTDII